ncbi:uncharacterized protein [Littorina saxatilis]|uniref:Regulatory factor X-associated protein RFXANK-binding domain-containing protein n=1 Tax=Littorina saxatilis TaxID=31220 RepID=A0AAN9B3R0_9CAEN
MASPTVDLCSSENSLSEDAAHELTGRASANKERNLSTKSEVSESPTPDSKAKGWQSKKGVSLKTGGAAWSEDGAEAGGQLSTGRKKRARATPAEDAETNGRKSATDNSGRDSTLWPGADGEGPLQGSLLEEVLAEKRMALMRSPEVLRFLQLRQTAVQATNQQQVALETQQVADFNIGELEEDAKS